MFDTDNINYDGQRFLCRCKTTVDKAKNIEAKYTMLSRTTISTGEIYARGNIVTIDTPSKEATQNIANYINIDFFLTQVEVYVFQGRSKIGLSDRICIGINLRQKFVKEFIERMNTVRTINADCNPQNWIDMNYDTYSVIVFPVCNGMDLNDEYNKERLNFTLDAISKQLMRKLKVTVIGLSVY